MNDRQRTLSTALAAVCSLAAIAWVASRIDWGGAVEAAGHLHFAYIPVLVDVYMLSHLLRGWRWQRMLHPIKPIGLQSSTEIVLVGYMANNLLPLRLGEIVRGFLLARREQIGKVTAISSIGVERIFDGLILLGCLAASACFAPIQSDQSTRMLAVGWFAAALFAAAFGGVLLLRIRPQIVLGSVAWFGRWLPETLTRKITETVHSVLDSLAFVRFDRNFLAIIALGLGVWLVEGCVFWFCLAAFDLTPSITLAFFTLAVVNLGILIPSAPGYVGVFQLGAVIAFATFGINAESATAYSIVIHLCQYVPVTLAGLAILNVRGYSLRDLPDSASSDPRPNGSRSCVDAKESFSSFPLTESAR